MFRQLFAIIFFIDSLLDVIVFFYLQRLENKIDEEYSKKNTVPLAL